MKTVTLPDGATVKIPETFGEAKATPLPESIAGFQWLGSDTWTQAGDLIVRDGKPIKWVDFPASVQWWETYDFPRCTFYRWIPVPKPGGLDDLVLRKGTLTAEQATLTAEQATLTAEQATLTAEQATLTASADTLDGCAIHKMDAFAYLTPDAKPTNPKDLIGSNKIPLHLWPSTATALGALAFLDGALKYGRGNFREVGVRSSIYYDAASRHLAKWFEGEDTDPDSGLPHLAHALACIAILIDAGAAGKLNDDRALPIGYEKFVADLTPHVERLKARHAGRNPKHYSIEDRK